MNAQNQQLKQITHNKAINTNTKQCRNLSQKQSNEAMNKGRPQAYTKTHSRIGTAAPKPLLSDAQETKQPAKHGQAPGKSQKSGQKPPSEPSSQPKFPF
jgi:hypothetical protein